MRLYDKFPYSHFITKVLYVASDRKAVPGMCIVHGGQRYSFAGGGRVVRWCWVNFQCWGVLLVWIIVGQGPIALAVGADGGLFGHFFSLYPFSTLSPSLWETARYRLKYCLKGPLNPKQPTNQIFLCVSLKAVQKGALCYFVLFCFCRELQPVSLKERIPGPRL